MDISSVFDYSLIHATIRLSTPILLAALAVIITQWAGVLNLGIEGTMTLGAFTAISVSYFTGSWLLAIVAAVVVGSLVSLLIGIAHIKFKADIFAVGMTINILAVALTTFLLNGIFQVTGSLSSDQIVPLPQLNMDILEHNAVLNSILNKYSLFEIFAIIFVFGESFFLFRTAGGLRLRSVGLNELAAETAGINVGRTKYLALLFSGIIGGLAGAHLSLGYSNFFTAGMVSGRGFMGIAAMFFSGGSPGIGWAACLLFGAVDSIGSRMQAYGFPPQFVLMLPYLTTIIVLIISMWRKLQKSRKKARSYSHNRQ